MAEPRQIRILYMEDDPGLARLVQKKLERAGYDVDVARDGESGLAMYAAGPYDVVAVDQSMPIHDGLEVIRVLASRGPLPPTVMITGAGNEKIAVEAMKLGARDYIVKDVDGGYLDLLPVVIEQALQQQRLVEERQQALEALRESEERFRTLANAAQDAIAMIDNEGRISYWNPAAERIFGYTEREAIGKDLHALVIPEKHRQAFQNRSDALQKSGQGPAIGATLELEAIRRGGAEFPVELSLSVVQIKGKWHAVGIIRDITERKRTEAERERLLAAEREQRLLAETLAEVTLALTSQTSHEAVLDEILRQAQRIVPHSTANIALLERESDTLRTVRWQGYEPLGCEGMISNLVCSATELPLDAEVIRSRKAAVISDTHQEPHWVTFDETAWIRSYLAVPICLRDCVLGILRLESDAPGHFSAKDAQRLQPLASAAAIAIENARLVEGLEVEVAARTAEILAEKTKSDTILRSVGEAIVMTDLELRVQYANEAFTALTGYTGQEVKGQHVGYLFGEEMPEQNRQSLRLALVKGEGWQGEVPIRRKDGRTYDAVLTIASMRDAEGNLVGYVSSHRDISQLKDLERARSRFITNVSHQLRTPVTTIQLNAHLLREGRRPEKTKYYLQIIEEETARLIHLIQDILEIATLDSGQAASAWEPVSLSTVIEDTITRYQARAEASDLALAAGPIPTDLPVVKGDQARLARALGEIVENALVFTPAGGRVIVEAKTVEDEGQPWVTIAVRDTGPGIPPEEQERVFDRFYRGSLAESGHIPGTGLGLSIADEILRAHGGRVTVESEVGKGTTFTLWLRSTPE